MEVSRLKSKDIRFTLLCGHAVLVSHWSWKTPGELRSPTPKWVIFFKICSSWMNACKHFSLKRWKASPSVGWGISQKRPLHSCTLSFLSFYTHPFSFGFISQRSTLRSIIRRLQPWPLYFFNNGFRCRSEFSLPSTCRCVVPDNNPHLAWELREGMCVLDLVLVEWYQL